MGTNLGQDTCECGRKVMLSDFRGKPVEFRQHGEYVPQMGVRFDCDCGVVYFIWYEVRREFWGGLKDQAFKDRLFLDFHSIPNKSKGRFARKTVFRGKEHIVELGCYQIDMAYYDTFRDETNQDTQLMQLEEALSLLEKEQLWTHSGHETRHLLLGEAEASRLDN